MGNRVFWDYTTVAHKCHGQTEKPRQKKAMTKQKRRQHEAATGKSKIHSKIK